MKTGIKRTIYFIIVAVCVIIFIAFIIKSGKENSSKQAYSETGFSMGTVLTITLYGKNGEQTSDDITELPGNLENGIISWRTEGSEVYRINHEYEEGVPYPVSNELAEYIMLAKEISDKGAGLLDITIRPLADIWGIEDGNTTVPDEKTIEAALGSVDYTRVHIKASDGTECSLKSDVTDDEDYFITFDEEDMSIDLGAIGKGIACDVINEYLQSETVSGTVTGACIAVGGSILCYGEKPDGGKYSIGIRNPRGDESSVMGVISIDSSESSVFVSTSGDYEKYFIENGIRYHHILNPKTGFPADTGTISATIICDNGALSDALSTICILLDKDEALELVKSYGAEAVLIDENKNVYVTEGIASNFEITDEDYNFYD